MKLSGPIPNHILQRLPEIERKSLGKIGTTSDEVQATIEARSEKELQGHISSLLSRNGIPFIVQRMDRKSNLALGWPDFTFCLNGRFCAWEVKMPGKFPEDHQEKVIQKIRECGGLVEVVRSYEQALKILESWKAKKS